MPPHIPRTRWAPGLFTAVGCLMVVAAAGIGDAHAWGGPHVTITRAALATLPESQSRQFGDEWSQLGSLHCLIPDRVYADKEIATYAMMDSRPGKTYLVNLHLPATQPENFEVLQYFMEKGVVAMRAGDLKDAARYAGTLAHVLEDWSCPAHCVPGDNMFTLFKQFLPPPDSWRYALLHSPVESGGLEVKIDGRRPARLGGSVNEAAFVLLQRANDGIIAARAQVIPIIQGLYGNESNRVTKAQTTAAVFGAGLVADALHTMFSLGEMSAEAPPAPMDLSACIPLEATNLAFPQSAFFSRPYWGHAQRGVILRDGTNAVPLALMIEDAGKTSKREFGAGMGTGTRSSLTYFVPQDLYDQFTVWVGLQAGIGTTGDVLFSVLGNGAELGSARVTGTRPARRLAFGISGVTNLQLVATSAGGDGKGNYAVWAEPKLIKSGAPKSK